MSDKYTPERITEFHAWTPKLFSFNITRPSSYRFTAGQFARLGVEKPDGTLAWRAYSIVSADYAPHLSFYSIAVPDGEFTSVLAGMGVGSTVYLDKTNFGFLTLARFDASPVGAQKPDLWLLSSGTGLAPFISILHELAVWEQYARVIVVHCVRSASELIYRDVIQGFSAQAHYSDFFTDDPKRLVYVPIVTQVTQGAAADSHTSLHARIPALLASGELERHVGASITPTHSRVMICGNPDMVTDTRNALKAKGLAVSRSAAPGQIAVENYW